MIVGHILRSVIAAAPARRRAPPHPTHTNTHHRRPTMDVNILSRVDSVYPLIDREKSDKNLPAGEVWRPPAAAPQLPPDHHHHHPQTRTRARAHTHSRWDAPVERPPARGAFSWAAAGRFGRRNSAAGKNGLGDAWHTPQGLGRGPRASPIGRDTELTRPKAEQQP